jgi:hypothetical protein
MVKNSFGILGQDFEMTQKIKQPKTHGLAKYGQSIRNLNFCFAFLLQLP